MPSPRHAQCRRRGGTYVVAPASRTTASPRTTAPAPSSSRRHAGTAPARPTRAAPREARVARAPAARVRTSNGGASSRARGRAGARASTCRGAVVEAVSAPDRVTRRRRPSAAERDGDLRRRARTGGRPPRRGPARRRSPAPRQRLARLLGRASVQVARERRRRSPEGDPRARRSRAAPDGRPAPRTSRATTESPRPRGRRAPPCAQRAVPRPRRRRSARAARIATDRRGRHAGARARSSASATRIAPSHSARSEQPAAPREPRARPAGARDVERERAVEQRRGQAAEEQVRVGQRERPAPPVGGRTRRRPGALGPDPQRAAGVEPDDRARRPRRRCATSSEGTPSAKPPSVAPVVTGSSVPSIQQTSVLVPPTSNESARGRPRRRARASAAAAPAAGPESSVRTGRAIASAGLIRGAVARRIESRPPVSGDGDPRDVAADARAHVGVEHGRLRALDLAGVGADARALVDGERPPRASARARSHARGDPTRSRGGDRRRRPRPRSRRPPARRAGVRRVTATPRSAPVGRPCARRARRRPRPPTSGETVRAGVSAWRSSRCPRPIREQVAEPVGRDEADARPAPRQHGVRGDGGAVVDTRVGGEGPPPSAASAPGTARAGSSGVLGDLPRREARRARGHDVGEGPAGVDPEDAHGPDRRHEPAPARTRRDFGPSRRGASAPVAPRSGGGILAGTSESPRRAPRIPDRRNPRRPPGLPDRRHPVRLAVRPRRRGRRPAHGRQRQRRRHQRRPALHGAQGDLHLPLRVPARRRQGLRGRVVRARTRAIPGAAASPNTMSVVCGSSAILGHVFTPYLGFKGGKGVATALGVVTALATWQAIYAVGDVGRPRRLHALRLARLDRRDAHDPDHVLSCKYGDETFHARFGIFAFLTVCAAIVVWRHRENIRRLLDGPRAQDRRAERPPRALTGCADSSWSGDGGWGTAVAIHLARKGLDGDDLVARRRLRGATSTRSATNPRFLPGYEIPARGPGDGRLRGGRSPDAELVVSAVPTEFLRAVWGRHASRARRPALPILSLTKGVEQGTHAPSLADPRRARAGPPPRGALGPQHRVGGREGPARRFRRRAATRGSRPRCASTSRAATFRVYSNPDVVGVELGGALKNVIALASGLCDGLGLGHNAKAALLTRGVIEMARLGQALGAERRTFFGLSGPRRPDDDVQLPHEPQSHGRRAHRARRAPRRRARLDGADRGGRQVGRPGPRARPREGLSLPISEEVYRVLHEARAPKDSVEALMSRGRQGRGRGSRLTHGRLDQGRGARGGSDAGPEGAPGSASPTSDRARSTSQPQTANTSAPDRNVASYAKIARS